MRQDVAAELRVWPPGKPAGQPLFPVRSRKRKAMLRADLKAAGIPPVVDGKVIDVHALRVTFITSPARSGVEPPVRVNEPEVRPEGDVALLDERGPGPADGELLDQFVLQHAYAERGLIPLVLRNLPWAAEPGRSPRRATHSATLETAQVEPRCGWEGRPRGRLPCPPDHRSPAR